MSVSATDPAAERWVSGVCRDYLELGYREDLAHLVYAGADLLVAPSMFEPCGLAPHKKSRSAASGRR